MEVNRSRTPGIGLENHPNYRVVQVSVRQGRVGMLLPHANLVMPDRQAIGDLKDIIQLYQKLKPQGEGTSADVAALTQG